HNIGPNTDIACYYPFSFNPRACEDPNTCIVQGQRKLPCPPGAVAPVGQVCSPCANDSECPGGACVAKRFFVNDPTTGNPSLTVVEQFCSTTCDPSQQPQAGYACMKPAQSPIAYLIPVNSNHAIRSCTTPAQ